MSSSHFSLGVGSGAYSAMDDVSSYLNREIVVLAKCLPEDPGDLAGFGALLFALVSLGECTGGYVRPSFDVGEMRERILKIDRDHVAEYNVSPDEIKKRIDFFEGLFERAEKLVE